MSGFALHLLRHGACERAERLLGHTDAPPTDAGTAACVARTDRLDFSRVICSDLARARLPAEAIAASRSVPLRIDPRWRELDFGQWDGSDPAGLDAALLGCFWDDPEAHPPPSGERWGALLGRVGAALAAIGEPALVVTHAGAIRAALACLLGFDHRQSWAFDLPHAALLSLRIWRGENPSAQITALEAL